MSQFNQPPGKQNYQPQGYGQQSYGQAGYGQGSFNPPPQQNSGGSNTLLIVLAIVGGIVVLFLGFCLVMAMMVKSSFENMAGELSSMAASSMAESIVSKYEDNDEVVSRIGAIDSHELQDKDLGFELFTKRKVAIDLKGDKGTGTLILYRKNGSPDRVTLLNNGEEILIDDKPDQSLGNQLGDETEWEDADMDDSAMEDFESEPEAKESVNQ